KPLLTQTQELIKAKDYKQAYDKSHELTLLASSNANIHYVNATVAKNIGKTAEALESLSFAQALDCEAWRGSPVFNSILRKMASERQIILFDFQKMIMNDWKKNVLFLDDIHPQNLYFEKASMAIAQKIK